MSGMNEKKGMLYPVSTAVLVLALEAAASSWAQ